MGMDAPSGYSSVRGEKPTRVGLLPVYFWKNL